MIFIIFIVRFAYQTDHIGGNGPDNPRPLLLQSALHVRVPGPRPERLPAPASAPRGHAVLAETGQSPHGRAVRAEQRGLGAGRSPEPTEAVSVCAAG